MVFDMTPQEFKSARRALGLSAQGMANALGIGSGRTIRRWEAGQNNISAMAEKLIRGWLDDLTPEQNPSGPGSAARPLQGL